MNNIIKVKKYSSIVLLLFLFSYPVSGISAQETQDRGSECLKESIEFSKALNQQQKFKEEIAYLKERADICEQNSSLYTRISLRYLELGDTDYGNHVQNKKGDRKALYYDGLRYARMAIKSDKNYHKGYEMSSTAFAAIISESGLKAKAHLADSVRIYAEKALELAPENDRAIHILGRWHYEVSQLGWLLKMLSGVIYGTRPEGSIQKAIYYFKRSVELEDFPVHRYWLAKAYLAAGEKGKAIEQLKYLQTLPYGQKNDDYFKKEALKLLSKLERD